MYGITLLEGKTNTNSKLIEWGFFCWYNRS